MTNYWHWIVIVAVIFACLYVYKQQTLKGIPLIGQYLSS